MKCPALAAALTLLLIAPSIADAACNNRHVTDYAKGCSDAEDADDHYRQARMCELAASEYANCAVGSPPLVRVLLGLAGAKPEDPMTSEGLLVWTAYFEMKSGQGYLAMNVSNPERHYDWIAEDRFKFARRLAKDALYQDLPPARRDMARDVFNTTTSLLQPHAVESPP